MKLHRGKGTTILCHVSSETSLYLIMSNAFNRRAVSRSAVVIRYVLILNLLARVMAYAPGGLSEWKTICIKAVDVSSIFIATYGK